MNKNYNQLTRPKFFKAFFENALKGWLLVTSSILALIIAILSWVFPSPNVQAFFRWLFIGLLIILSLIFIFSTIIYHIRINNYIISIEEKIILVKKLILSYSNINMNISIKNRFVISGIMDNQGTVNLVIPISSDNSLLNGSKLDVVVSETNERWGTVEVIQILEKHAKAKPFNRINIEFWESLEDRMKTDPSAPLGFHLEPSLPQNLLEIMAILNSEEKL